jgi:hypothetical protein
MVLTATQPVTPRHSGTMLDKIMNLLIMPIPSETGIDILRITRHLEVPLFS